MYKEEEIVDCSHEQNDLLIDGCRVTCLRCGKRLEDLER